MNTAPRRASRSGSEWPSASSMTTGHALGRVDERGAGQPRAQPELLLGAAGERPEGHRGAVERAVGDPQVLVDLQRQRRAEHDAREPLDLRAERRHVGAADTLAMAGQGLVQASRGGGAAGHGGVLAHRGVELELGGGQLVVPAREPRGLQAAGGLGVLALQARALAGEALRDGAGVEDAGLDGVRVVVRERGGQRLVLALGVAGPREPRGLGLGQRRVGLGGAGGVELLDAGGRGRGGPRRRARRAPRRGCRPRARCPRRSGTRRRPRRPGGRRPRRRRARCRRRRAAPSTSAGGAAGIGGPSSGSRLAHRVVGGAQRGGVAVPGELAGEGGAVLVGPAGRVLGVAAGGAGGLESATPRSSHASARARARSRTASSRPASSRPGVTRTSSTPGSDSARDPATGSVRDSPGASTTVSPSTTRVSSPASSGTASSTRAAAASRAASARTTSRARSSSSSRSSASTVLAASARSAAASPARGLVDAPQPLGEVGELGAVAGGGHRPLGRVGGPAGLAALVRGRRCRRRGGRRARRGRRRARPRARRAASAARAAVSASSSTAATSASRASRRSRAASARSRASTACWRAASTSRSRDCRAAQVSSSPVTSAVCACLRALRAAASASRRSRAATSRSTASSAARQRASSASASARRTSAARSSPVARPLGVR